jgi:hypothetical protein
MVQRRLGTLAATFVALGVVCGSGCSLILDFDLPPTDGPPDSPVNDTACMAFEPIDSPMTAMPITPGDYEAAICGADADYFKITVDGTQSVFAKIDFQNRNGAGDIDLRLLNGDGGQVRDESRTSNDSEDVMCPGGITCNGPLVAGDYLLHVLGFNASVQSQYVLHLEIGAVEVDAGVD